MRQLCSLVAAAIGCALLSLPAYATTFTVSTTGNDSNNGTSSPWKTLQKAANTVQPGDTVLVENGTYAGFRVQTSGFANARIVFKSKTKWGAKVTSKGPQGDPDNILVLSASYVTIDGFEVSNAERAGICVRSLSSDTGIDTQNNIVENCYSHDNGLPSGGAHDGIFTGFARNFTARYNVCNNNGEHGIYVSNSADFPTIIGNTTAGNRNCGIQINADASTGSGGQDGIISNWVVDGNVIYDNGAGGGAGINLDGCVNGFARNNLIYNNLASGIALYGIDGADPSRGNAIINNTIYNPNSTRAALLVDDGANDNIAFNNILYSGIGLEIGSVSGFQHNYNRISSIQGGSYASNESAPTAASLFAAIGLNNYHLAVNANAVDTGISILGLKAAPGIDLDGNLRPLRNGYDIGCYEMPTGTRSISGNVYKWRWVGSNLERDEHSGANVALIQSGVTIANRTTSSSGFFNFGNFNPSVFQLKATDTGIVFDPGKLTAKALAGDVTGLVFESYVLRIRVVNGGGTPVSNVTVRLTGAATKQAVTNTGGFAYFEGLGRGSYTVRPVGTGFIFTPTTRTINLPTTGLAGLSPNATGRFTRTANATIQVGPSATLD